MEGVVKLDQDTKVWVFVIMVVLMVGFGTQVVKGMGFARPDGSNLDQLAFMVLTISVAISWGIVFGNPFREKPPSDGPPT